MAGNMFGDYSSIFDAATADNVGVRDRALSVAQLQPGRATVYGAYQAGGMLMQNLASMAGMKTGAQEKAELITNIMKESRNLDPNDPQSSLILSRKFTSAGLPNIAQKFAQNYRDMSVKNIELGHKDTELEQQEKHYEAQASQNTEELAYRRELEITRVLDLSAKLKIDADKLQRDINMGTLIQVGVPGNTTGAMTWASRICDERGQNCKITPLMAEGYKPTVAPVTTVVDGQVAVEPELTDATGVATNINTFPGLSASGYRISDFGASPTGSAESRAYNVIRDDLILVKGKSEGSELFIQRIQKDKAAIASAGVTAQVGVTLFNDVRASRETTGDKLDMISTAISGFLQAKTGNAAAGKLAEGLVQQIFLEKRLAVSEITRISKAGSLLENVLDAMNSLFSGVKTTQHYDAFIDVLRKYEKDQTEKYNYKSDTMKQFAEQIGYTDLPGLSFEHRAVPSGGFILRFNPETNGFDQVAI